MAQRFEPTFDMYGAAPPDGEWGYVVDDYDITYGPGWWPYHRDGKPGTVRVSPNTEFRSWRNEYVLISPNLTASATVVARLHLFLRAQGMGAMTVAACIGVDIRQRTFSLLDGLPTELHEQATVKGRRLLDLILAGRTDRRRSAARPRTAADLARQPQR